MRWQFGGAGSFVDKAVARQVDGCRIFPTRFNQPDAVSIECKGLQTHSGFIGRDHVVSGSSEGPNPSKAQVNSIQLTDHGNGPIGHRKM